jgi:hypothetical protein
MRDGRRSTAALVISILALVMASIGVGYAAVKINGTTIKVGSTPGNRLKSDSVTGQQVNEPSLTQVPSAARAASAATADHAASATSADHAASADRAASAERIGSLTEGDIQRAGKLLTFDVRAEQGDPSQTLVQAGPFTIKASCLAGGSAHNGYKVTATTSENDAAVRAFNIFDAELGDTDFDVGESFTLNEGEDGSTNPLGPYGASAFLWSRGGTMVRLEYAQGGHLFSGNVSEQADCTWSGFAVIS